MASNVIELRRERNAIRITQQALEKISREVFYEGVERAAMLIGPKGTRLVTHVVLD